MIEKVIRSLYVKFIRPHITREILLQRLKLIWHFWGYSPILSLGTLSIAQRDMLFRRFVLIDWNILHSHRPCEIAIVVAALAKRPAKKGEAFIEAGCWNGGSSTKFSIACKMLGYKLHICDSFAGVEQLSEEKKSIGFDFSGQYPASQRTVQQNLSTFGEIDVCCIHRGWFSDTLAKSPVELAIRVVYIDCVSANGTKEVLIGVAHSIVSGESIFTQDFHIRSVRNLLRNANTWRELRVNPPDIRHICANLGVILFANAST